jgi:hypothetical protein
MSVEFDEYLAKKKINADKFCKAEPEIYLRFARVFVEMHEYSFTMQKLYWINKLRRMYQQN